MRLEPINNIRVFDPQSMACFADGNCYEIGRECANLMEGEAPTEKALRTFAQVVAAFPSPYPLELVYIEEYGYYLVAILGFVDEDFRADTDEMSDLYDTFHAYLELNHITFG